MFISSAPGTFSESKSNNSLQREQNQAEQTSDRWCDSSCVGRSFHRDFCTTFETSNIFMQTGVTSMKL